MGPTVEFVTFSGPISVHPYQTDHATDWKAFLAGSNNGTVFHNLSFLAYHRPERFDTHHLMFRQNGRLIALLPAAVVTEPDGRAFLKSPYGASIGGFVLPVGQRAEVTLGSVACLKNYAMDLNLAGIEMRLGPSLYAKHPSEDLSFALACSGFGLIQRWLVHIIPLPSDPAQVVNCLISRRRRSYVRSALRQGVRVRVADFDCLPVFYRILASDRARYGTCPTHTLSELERILRLVPQQVQLFVCEYEGQVIGGSLVFELNDRVAYSFYPCHDPQFERCRPGAMVTVAMAEHYASRAFRYLDLGPSSFDDSTLNQGLARFKEEMGAQGFCRDAWRWVRT